MSEYGIQNGEWCNFIPPSQEPYEVDLEFDGEDQTTQGV